jgi:hypothetical protein
MIMRTDHGDDLRTYRILDSHGQLIGRVRAPRDQPALGPGAGTVFLVRDRNPGFAARPARALPADYRD